MRKSYKCCLVLSFLMVFPFILGCPGNKGPKVYPVSGTITMDGQPLPGAKVVFMPTNPGGPALSATGQTDESGKFTVQTSSGTAAGGTTEGEYKVTVRKTRDEWDGHSYLPNPGGEPIKDSKAVDDLPPIYGKVAETPFSATVTKDKTKNVYTFDLQSKP